jgi:hypothetical protein
VYQHNIVKNDNPWKVGVAQRDDLNLADEQNYHRALINTCKSSALTHRRLACSPVI